MKQFRMFFKQHKIVFFVTIFIIVTIFMVPFLKSFSESSSDSAWDGVVAKKFASGTGTIDNPFIISNANEFGYFKELLENDDASFYADKNYLITNSFNYGKNDISINNNVPFSGTLDGGYNTIDNALVSNYIFNELDGAKIKNISFRNINYELLNEKGAILAYNIKNSNISMFLVAGDVNNLNNNFFGGLSFTSSNNFYNNVVLNYDIKSSGDNNFKFLYESFNDKGSNILVNNDNISFSDKKIDIIFDSFTINGKNIKYFNIDNLNKYSLNGHRIDFDSGYFVFKNIDSYKNDTKSPTRDTSFVTHASGLEGNTLYVNDLDADYNYFKGLNFTEIRNTSIPNGKNSGFYDDDYLVKVEIIYDGTDYNNSSLVGKVSPIDSENTNKFVYYKYYSLERNSSGTLLTNADGDNYIRIELIDNPFSKRPYAVKNNETVEYGFNGWVCNQDEDTSVGVCNNSKFIFDKSTYTRYVDIAVSGGSQIVIHLNASWYDASVITNYNDISNFDSMSMQQIPTRLVAETVHHVANIYWKNNYTTMNYYREYTQYSGYMPYGYWYKTNQNGTTYTQISNSSTRCNSTRCYVYRANTSGIVANSLYNGSSSIQFFPNFNSSASTQTATTVDGYSSTYMYLIEDSNGSYSYNETIYKNVLNIPNDGTSGGFFYRVNYPSNDMINTGTYYTYNGTLCTNSSNCTTAYKLIQYNDDLKNSDGTSIYYLNVDENGDVYNYSNYYYLVTRDLNIFRYTSSSYLDMSYLEVAKPFTVTGTSLTGTSSSGILEYPYSYSWGAFQASDDLVIENIRIYGLSSTGTSNLVLGSNSKVSRVIYAASHNLKIGRNVINSLGSNYMVAEAVFGGTNSNVSGSFKVIIESGIYYAYHSGSMSSSGNFSLNELTVLGSDYDRVLGNNNKLRFNIGLDGYSAGSHTAGSNSLFASFTTIKSGKYGFNSDDTPNSDNTSGLYIGGRSSLCVNSITGARVQGGIINTIFGGYGYGGNASSNSTYIGVSGGTIRAIYGGAGFSTTKGNRIINVTGGLINYSILGGSDSYSSNSTSDGIVQGSTLIYVGGNSIVGDNSSSTLYGVSSGSVFGAGGGNSSSSAKGTVYNSHIIINGGTIRDAVYGGGNYGSTGTQSSSNALSLIEIYDGNIANIYGGSKSAGFGKSTYANTNLINVEMYGGTVSNLYGGSNVKGTVYGSIKVNINGGTVSNNVYGGGQGSSTFVTNDVDVKVGNSSISGVPSIGGNVYGGSAFGTVNSSSSTGTKTGNTTVTVNNGIINGSVFGGGQGSSSYTPYVIGDIDVFINGGDITSVFGGNDQSGNFTGVNEVHLNGGIVQDVYGGGNRSSVTNTNVYLDGASVTSIYGGSNTLGNVNTTNVDIISGTVQNIYGGNNEGGNCNTSDINITGTAVVNGSVYSGGNEVATTTTTVTLNSLTGSISNVYGGGNRASVTTSNVINNGVSVDNLFGGSNASGTVTNSNVTYNNGVTSNLYGGNNEGGNTINSYVYINGGTISNTYGGGNQANGENSILQVTAGSITSLFGGGNNAGLDTSNITVVDGDIEELYGGSNNSGNVSSTNILITDGNISSIYGGGNRAIVGMSYITINNGSISNVYGGGNLAQVSGNTSVDINGGNVSNNVYGGGNFGVVNGSSTVSITNATILGSAYAGGNGVSATLNGNTSITVDGNTVIGSNSSIAPSSGCVFGGGNQAYTGLSSNNNSTSHVNIVGGTIYGNVYGGANTSVIYGNTIVNIGQTAYISDSLLKADIYIKGNIFGGGEANASGSEIYDWSFISVTQGVNISIDASTYDNFKIDGSFFGGGNASSSSGDSYLSIRNYGSGMNPKRNVSIQRVTYVTIDNSSILLAGAIDRANDYDKELFSISRVDDFRLQNNSYIFLVTGANLLKSFQSLDNSGSPAKVTITDEHDITQKTVDNRVYMYEGRNLNIAKDQQVTDYGIVTGMSFLGIFNFANGDVNTGIYSNQYNTGDLLDWSGLFAKGSYVLGRHVTDHDITIDGFYSNFMNEENSKNEVSYIDPTPKNAQFYMWYIGENIIEYNVDLVASKYSTLGSVEQSFLEFSKPNTSFEVESFDISDIASGISLVDKNNIPRIASNEEDANNIFGLSMEASNNGWLTNGKTSFYTSSPWISGETYYEGENSNIVPTMLFYLYHSKNITEEKELGTVRITIKSITKLNALSNEVKRLVVNVNMSTALFQTTEYEGSMTPGDKYELFTSTSTNITTKSKFSTYFGLYANDNIYRSGYHRALTSSYILPENTKITMIDFGTGSTEYYYHVINASDVARTTQEYSLENECSYDFSLFTAMGSVNSNNNYNDQLKNSIYFDGINSSEEFIFIVDFSDANIQDTHLNNQLLIEIRDSDNEAIVSVLGIQHEQLTYNLYSGKDSIIDETVSESANPLYIGYNDIFEVSVDYQNSTLSGITITDTQYFDSMLGVQISIRDIHGKIVSGTDLTGAYFLIDGVRYYPDIDGYTHIKLADKVGNTKKWIVFNTENAGLATGTYTFTFEAFASIDGIYYSTGTSSFDNVEITIINSKYGLNPKISDDSVVFSSNNNKPLKLNIDYTSILSNPSIRLVMYRREYNSVYDTNYELVDFQDYVEQVLVKSSNDKEYMLTNNPNEVNEFTIPLNAELMTGTYRLAFRLYDGDVLIGEINRYIIVK